MSVKNATKIMRPNRSDRMRQVCIREDTACRSNARNVNVRHWTRRCPRDSVLRHRHAREHADACC
jgi:hypothetical protein